MGTLVAYVRLWSMAQLDGYGRDVQRAGIDRRCIDLGLEVARWCEDVGVTEALDSPGLAEALALITTGLYGPGWVGAVRAATITGLTFK